MTRENGIGIFKGPGGIMTRENGIGIFKGPGGIMTLKNGIGIFKGAGRNYDTENIPVEISSQSQKRNRKKHQRRARRYQG